MSYSYDYNRSHHAEAAPYVHPSRMQTTPSAEQGRSSGVDFSAPVIHFGTSREVAPRQNLKDQHFTRAQEQSFLTAMTKEQKLHTIYIGELVDELDDFWMERILKSVGKLRQWKRAFNGIGDPCNFGFAEYEDPEHVRRALTLLQAMIIPGKKGSEDLKLKITQDEMSALYVEDVLTAKGHKGNEAKERNALSSASGQLEKVLKDFKNPKYTRPDDSGKPNKADKQTATVVDPAAAVTIMLSIEDELGDIPEEQRESIAKEITSFRERSAKRDQDRARQIADVETRRLEFERASRQDIKNGHKQNGNEEIAMIRRPKKDRAPFEEQNMTEDEIARQREERRAREAEINYLSEVQRWHSNEATRISALNRESRKQEEEASRLQAEAQRMLQKLANFDDDQESIRPTEDFYKDRAAWIRGRAAVKARETVADDEDRAAERKELQRENTEEDTRAGGNDNETQSRKAASESQPVRLSLAARKTEERSRPVVNAEAILEDDEDTSGQRRVLVPLQYDDDNDQQAEGQEALQERLTAIVARIPVDIVSLRRQAVKWDKLDASIEHKLRAFTAKKILEAIGIEEEDLISVVMSIVGRHGTPEEIESELTAAIGDAEESETITARIWRFLLILLETAGIE